MSIIWCCRTCRVGVRVPDGAPRSKLVYRCPRCRGAISFNDPPGSSPDVFVDVEVADEVIGEVEAFEPPPIRRPPETSPRAFARRTTRRPPKRRRKTGSPAWVWAVVAGVAMFSVVLVGILVLVLWPAPTSTSGSNPTPVTPAGGGPPPPDAPAPMTPALPLKPRITIEKFDQVKNGMTQAEVEAILGFPGRVLSREKVGFGVHEGKEMKSVRWDDGQGGHLQLTFLDGLLINYRD